MLKGRRWLLLSLVIAMLAIPVPSSAQETGPIYIVQAGDTLSAIARRFGVSQDLIVQANGIVDPARLFPGDSLLLPGFPGIEGELTLRTVDPGETFTSLSYQYGLDPVDLARLNRIVRLESVYAGQSVFVPVGSEGTEAELRPVEIVLRGETRLERTARLGQSPYTLFINDEDPFHRWLLPGTSPLKQGETGIIALPQFLENLTISPYPLTQGNTALIQISGAEGYSYVGELGENQLQFFQNNDGGQSTLQGVHALADPGSIDFSIEVRSEESGEAVYGFRQPIQLNEGDYGFRILSGVPPETVDPAVTQPEEDLIAALLSPKTETKFWEGSFDYPSQYYTEEFVSEFGTRRNYNNGALLYYHTGVDFYGNNVPIYAPADGVVVFADALTVRGNATYIDHGWGVYSGYLHQSELFVGVGERVERGQVIGLVGATGRVTGPHLHWEIWVGGVPVQPLDWVTEPIS
jgi:murein DD-endopeptidase MepM/ murein hydrolase activator NlpD